MRKQATRWAALLSAWLVLCAGLASGAENWEDLFDGKTLKGWVQRGGKAIYKAEDGVLVGSSVPNTSNSFLCTEKDYGDFILELEFKVDTELNSGVQIRSQSLKEYKDGRVHGYQVEIDAKPRAWSGGIYDEGRRGWLNNLEKNEAARKAFKQGEWNHFRIVAVGDSIKTWINGVAAADLKDSMTPSGFIGLQVHGVGKRTEPLQVRWRNIRIQDLSKQAYEPIPAEAFTTILSYEFGRNREAFSTIETGCRTAPLQERKAIEAKLVGVLRSARATQACKYYVCRILRRAGSEQSVPALAGLLADEKLADAARFALQEMDYPEVGKALRDALGKTSGACRIGIVNSLGERGDRQAVAQLAALAGGNDAAVSEAAIAALGKIGGQEATRALTGAKVRKDLEAAKADALLQCADSLVAEGKTSDAMAIYQEYSGDKYPNSLRIAAYRGIVLAEKTKAVPTIMTLLMGNNKELREAAGRFLIEAPGTETTRAVAGKLASLKPTGQVIVINALTARGDKAAASEVAKAAGSANEEVRVAALGALGVLGDAAYVEMLAKTAAGEGGAAVAAQASLTRLAGKGTDAAMLKSLEGASAGVRLVLIRSLVERGCTAAVPALLKAARDPESSVRKESQKGLSELAGEKDLPALIELLAQARNESDGRAVEKAVAAVSKRMGGSDRTVELALAQAPKASGMGRALLLRLLGRFADPKALKTINAGLKDTSAEVRDAAVHVLSEWPDATPAPTLLELAKSAEKDINRYKALRGYVRMVGLQSGRSEQEIKEMYQAALRVATRKEEKDLIQAALSGLRVTNLKVKSGKKYVVVNKGMKKGATRSIDRDYTYSKFPDYLLGATVIVTAMGDRDSKGDTFLSFQINVPATVYVGFDRRCKKPPAWLSGWKKTKDSVEARDKLNLFSKNFPAGTVTLGGNAAPGVGAMYSVFVKPAQ